MKEEEITALARELADELYNDDSSYRKILWWCEEPKERKSEELEYTLRFLLRRYCLVEKEAVLHGVLEVDKGLLFDHTFKCGYALGKQEKEEEDTVIQGWVFVDETTFDRHLCVRKVTQGDYEAVWDSGHPEFCLGEELFPDMVPNKLPEPVEIIIKRKKNG